MKTDINKYKAFVACLESIILECKPSEVIGRNGGFKFTLPGSKDILQMDFDSEFTITLKSEWCDDTYFLLAEDFNRLYSLFMTHIVFKIEKLKYDIPELFKSKSFIRNEKIKSLDI